MFHKVLKLPDQQKVCTRAKEPSLYTCNPLRLKIGEGVHGSASRTETTVLMYTYQIIFSLDDEDPSPTASEIDINDEDYASFARNTLSVKIVPSRKLATELPPSGQGASFILNHLENQKSYKGRITKRDFKWNKPRRSKKNKGKGKTVLFLNECGVYI